MDDPSNPLQQPQGDTGATSAPPSGPTISNAANAAVASSQQPGMTVAPSPVPPPAPPTPQRSHLADIVSAVGAVLGAPRTVRRVDPSTGQVSDVPRSTGQRVAGVAGTLLRGAAAGLGAQPGPGFAGRAAAAGMTEQAGYEKQQFAQTQEEEQEGRQQAESKRQDLLTQASLAKSAQEAVRMGFDIQSAKLKLSTDESAIFNSMSDIQSMPGARLIGTFQHNADLNSYLEHVGPSQSKQFAAQFARNQILTVPNPAGGMTAYSVPIGWQKQAIGPGHTVHQVMTDMDGNLKITAIPAPESMTQGDFYTWENAAGKQVVESKMQALDLQQKQQAVNKGPAELAETKARTNLINKQAEQLSATANAGPDALGFTPATLAGGTKEYNKRQDSFKKDADDLSKTEGTYAMFQNVLDDINAGKDVTGSKSVVALFNAIGLSATPLKGMGMRINSNTVAEHVEARGLGQSLYQKFLGLKDGDIITPQQIRDYASIATQARHDAYVDKINQAHSYGLRADFLLPQGNGRKIDPGTAAIFFDAAGRDPAKARAAAAKQGWVIGQ